MRYYENLNTSRRKLQGFSLWLCIICAVLLSFDPYAFSLSAGSPFYTRLTFHFFHGNIFHLFVNALAMLTISFHTNLNWRWWIFAYVAASTYPFASEPVIGLSAFIYVMLGILTPTCARPKEAFFIYISSIAMGVIFPNIAWGIHLYCYVIGLLAAFIRIWKRKRI